ncbi:hypothetical protein DFQ04_1387 [Algoriphagus boseongensis]|uniref:Uncharacterized protein n=1 Tax=Algoriphagus boseongensis TaxID=1442587 RepID=A0A4R6TDQ2_9BACT|nr:DUF6266 family protein [Algoriphagus boseongensis]TDQ19564.1 hypothetical protein DFQ04_1387 [Algoriphagus boseongensis]
MGKIESSFLKLISGRVGDMVIYNLNGKTIVRKRQGQRIAPLSELQRYHQEVFRLANAFFIPLKEELNFTYSAFEIGSKKGFHQAIGELIKQSVIHGEKPSVDHIKATISSGPLIGAREAKAMRINASQLLIEWSPNAWEGSARDGDLSYFLGYDFSRKRYFSIRNGAFRKEGKFLLEIPWDQLDPESFWLYMAFYRKERGKLSFSNSQYLGLF